MRIEAACPPRLMRSQNFESAQMIERPWKGLFVHRPPAATMDAMIPAAIPSRNEAASTIDPFDRLGQMPARSAVLDKGMAPPSGPPLRSRE